MGSPFQGKAAVDADESSRRMACYRPWGVEFFSQLLPGFGAQMESSPQEVTSGELGLVMG